MIQIEVIISQLNRDCKNFMLLRECFFWNVEFLQKIFPHILRDVGKLDILELLMYRFLPILKFSGNVFNGVYIRSNDSFIWRFEFKCSIVEYDKSSVVRIYKQQIFSWANKSTYDM